MIFVLSAIHPDKMVQVLRNIHTVRGINERKGKEMFYLTTHSTHFIYGYVIVRHLVKDHSDNERGNLLPSHGLLF